MKNLFNKVTEHIKDFFSNLPIQVIYLAVALNFITICLNIINFFNSLNILWLIVIIINSICLYFILLAHLYNEKK